MSVGRAVRIPRRSGSVVRLPRQGVTSIAGGLRPNRAGSQRATRLFGLYGIGVIVLYALVVASASVAPGGLAANVVLLVVIAILGGGLVGVGWWVTLGQTPRGISADSGSVVVWDRLGRRREFPTPAGAAVVVRRFPAGILASEPSVLVRLKDASGLPRLYLLGADLWATVAGPEV